MESSWKYSKRQCMNNPEHIQEPYQSGGSCSEEIFSIFKDKKKLSASDFKNVWSHYDTGLNGFIEAEELESFLADLFAAQGHHMCKQELESLRVSIIECYDENRDGKIEVSEMTKFLPVEDNFLLYFRMKGNSKMTCSDFLEIWKHYDKDKSGFLEEKEIGNFLHDLLQINRNVYISEDEMSLMVAEVIKNFDYNKDGMIEFNEMKHFLNVEDNVLTEMSLTENLSQQQFNAIFDYYDCDRNDFLEGKEIKRFVLDLMDRVGNPLTEEQQEVCIATEFIRCADTDSDGRISREDLASFLYTDQPIRCKSSKKRGRKTPKAKSAKSAEDPLNEGQKHQDLAGTHDIESCEEVQ